MNKDNKITVVFLIDYFKHKGGAEKNLYDIATGLDKKKFKPIVMSMSSGDMLEKIKDHGIEAYDLNIKKIYSPVSVLKAIRLAFFLKKRKADAMVTYHESSDFLGGIIGKLVGVKLISSRRDMGFKLKKRHVLTYKFVNKLFDKIITVSDAVKQIVHNREAVPLEKMVTIYNGVFLDKFQKDFNVKGFKEEIGIPLSCKVVGTVGNIRYIKGTDLFVQAMLDVISGLRDVCFIIVGKFEEKDMFYKQIKNTIKNNNFSDKVIFLGERTDIESILKIMDIFVLPSRSEGFSNAIVEAMAAGKPIISSDVGGNRESLENNVSGIIFKKYNELPLAILELLKNEKKAKELGENALQRAEKLFSVPVMLKTFSKLLVDIVNK